MSKAWRVVIIIVLVVLVLGAVCCGVGVITGADLNRTYSVLDDKYAISFYTDLDMWDQWAEENYGISIK